MIFYGSRGTHIHTEQVSGIKCSHCEKNTTHTISIFGRYAHVYWIPFFPLEKKGVSECNDCKVTLAPKDMNEPLKLAYQNVNSNVKSPLWYWSGLILIALLVIFFEYQSRHHTKDAISYINAPKVGDIYEYQQDNDFYTLSKVVSVSLDSVYIVNNKYGVDMQSGIDKINKPENFTGEQYGISKDFLKELFESKDILDVNRD